MAYAQHVCMVVSAAFLLLLSGCSSGITGEEAVSIAKSSEEVKAFLQKYPNAYVSSSFTDEHRCSDEDNAKSMCKGDYFWEVVFTRTKGRTVSTGITEDSPVEVWVDSKGRIISVCREYCKMNG